MFEYNTILKLGNCVSYFHSQLPSVRPYPVCDQFSLSSGKTRRILRCRHHHTHRTRMLQRDHTPSCSPDLPRVQGGHGNRISERTDWISATVNCDIGLTDCDKTVITGPRVRCAAS